ncbi:agmatinase [Jiella endophytica]|uniref:Agmatinase n=1 Tax=Jiella endophytica TaxID=2558362 RepID=A0A4Y8RVK4_9HYPH|nr:agmatinase [Jiella endophytica]TFF27867.1 agmatinase [Jiella endophytica]
MRLPVARPDEVDIALLGIPFDGGTTNRTGARHGPREIRNQSSLVRPFHHTSLTSPYDLAGIADCGDAPVNPVDPADSIERITGFYHEVAAAGAIPLTAGGDHLITLPILRGLLRGAPRALIHFDAHSDTYDEFFGNRYNHGTPFRRAVEEGLLDPKRMVQIGLRGAISDAANFDFAKAEGIRMIFIEELMARGVADVMAEAREIAGAAETYVSFDIDIIDPAFAPGTGTPEIGGITTFQAQALVRGLAGVDIVGADVVEVSPPLDPSGITALTGATMMFELLCVMAQATARRGG